MNNNLRNLLKQKLDAKIGVGHPVLGIMGNTAGVVEVPDRPGYVYVRINDTLAEVPNKRCAAQPGVEVWVGIDPIESNITQVLDYRASAIGTQTDYANLLKIHGKEHTWGGNDPAPIWGMQILDGRVTAYQALSIIVYPVMVLIPGTGYVNVAEMTPKDLTAYVPATAGYWVWVLVTINLSGAIVYTAGTPVLQASFGLDDIPTEPTDTIRVLGAVRLYNGQTNLYETINGSDILDLRGSSADTSAGSGGGGGAGGTGGAPSYLLRDATNDPLTGPLDINTTSATALRVQTASYTIGAEQSTGSFPVNGNATISGLTVGNWYAVEAFGGPWAPWDRTPLPFYTFTASNDAGITWSGIMGYQEAVPEDPLHRWPDPDMWKAWPNWSNYGEVVNTYYGRFYFQATTTSILVSMVDWNKTARVGTLSWRLYPVTAVFGQALNVNTTTGETEVTKLKIDVATGTVPIAVTSTTLNTNLNADLLDGKHASDFILSGSGVTSVTGTAPIASSGGTTPAISLSNSTVTPGSYTLTSLTVDAHGLITAASNGTVTTPLREVLQGDDGAILTTDTNELIYVEVPN